MKSLVTIRFFVSISMMLGALACQSQKEDTITESSQSQNFKAPITKILTEPLDGMSEEGGLGLYIRSNITSIVQDKNDILWFGSHGDGLISYDYTTLSFYSIEQGLPGKVVRDILEDDNGDLWLATNAGLTHFNGESFKTYTTVDGLLNNNLFDLAYDQTGQLWISSIDGPMIYDGESFEAFELPTVAKNEERYETSEKLVHNFLVAENNDIWMATDGGVFKYDGNILQHFTNKEGLCGNSVNSIYQDSSGKIWFATYGNGVCYWDGSRFNSLKLEDKLNDAIVWSIYEDKDLNIWFPVSGQCTYMYDGTTISNVFEKQSCVSHTMTSVLEDRKGELWFGGWSGAFTGVTP